LKTDWQQVTVIYQMIVTSNDWRNPLQELKRTDYERVRPLFRKMDIHLPLQAILAGNVDAPIYADNPLHPQTAITWTGHRFYLAGAPGNHEFAAAARKVFLEQYAMRSWKAGYESYSVHYPSEKWASFISTMLENKYPIKMQRSYYAYQANRINWKSMLSEGFAVRSVDKALLDKKWKNPEFLTEEMCSERPSVEDFLAKSFGVCLTHGDLIVGWCLSEYNTSHRCEVGIATHEDYQRRGFATLMTSAFIDMARSKDVARIGWHCAATNAGSAATALKAGFEKMTDYPVYVGWFDEAVNLANNGYFAHGRGEYAEAMAFFKKAFALGDVPDWIYWWAACDSALTSQTDEALEFLSQAIEHGFDNLENILSSKHLISLHETEGWQEIIKRLEAKNKA
jgi:RimJ/RimL family protein N-acetyltransferase